MPNNFLHTIQQLLRHETVILYEKWLTIPESDQAETTAFLAQSYQNEAAEYPLTAPEFDEKAAIWAAKTVYLACQLVLHRSSKPADLEQLLPDFADPQTASAILSADLTLRFLPDIITRLHVIDPDDELIQVLKTQLITWHYSGIRYPLALNDLNMEAILANPCLHQLYIDRVIAYKNKPLATHPALIHGIRASMGMFTADFWREIAHEV